MTDDAPSKRRSSVGRVLLWLVEAPVLGAVLVGLMAAYLRPGPYWWAQLVAIGLPYASWALAVFAVHQLRQSERSDLLALGALLVLGKQFCSLFATLAHTSLT